MSTSAGTQFIGGIDEQTSAIDTKDSLVSRGSGISSNAKTAKPQAVEVHGKVQ